MFKTRDRSPLTPPNLEARPLQRQQWQQNFSAATHCSISRERRSPVIGGCQEGEKPRGLQNPLNPSPSTYDTTFWKVEQLLGLSWHKSPRQIANWKVIKCLSTSYYETPRQHLMRTPPPSLSLSLIILAIGESNPRDARFLSNHWL